MNIEKKICVQGVCTNSPLAPIDTCPLGDSVVYELQIGLQLPSPYMSCSGVFDIIIRAGMPISAFCSDPTIGGLCCQSCKSKVNKHQHALITVINFMINNKNTMP